MGSRIEMNQEVVEAYKAAGNPWPASTRQIARWAIQHEQWEPTKEAMIRQCSKQLAEAMRQTYFKDPQGRNVRAMHPARYKQKEPLLWDDMRTASTNHMEAAFQLRRQQIVSDSFHLKQDIDSYNENYNQSGRQIPLELDFTDDVEELELEERGVAEVA